MTSPDSDNTRRAAHIRHRLIERVNGLISIDPHEQRSILIESVRGLLLGGVIGTLAGGAAWLFLTILQWATATRIANPWLLTLLPVVGFAVGLVYHHRAGAAARGNNLIIDELHKNLSTSQQPIPLYLAPLILIATVAGHLVGASVGREGTAVQMGVSLADELYRRLRFRPVERLPMLLAGVAGGFGGVFGTPLAGFVFALEVRFMGSVNYEAVLPCLVAAVVGDLVAEALGIRHELLPRIADVALDPWLALRVGVAGVAFGLCSLLLIELVHGIKHTVHDLIAYPPLRPALGGILLIGLTLLVGNTDYNGLSTPLATAVLTGGSVFVLAFLLKLLFTAVSLGTGFVGGEVTPLFVIGATLGAALGPILGIPSPFLAALGFVAVFAAASNTPLTCTLLGVELFGGGAAVYFAVACFSAYLFSGHRSIYGAQRLGGSKATLPYEPNATMDGLSATRPGWIRALPRATRRSKTEPETRL